MLPSFPSLSVSCRVLYIINSRSKAPFSTLHSWRAGALWVSGTTYPASLRLWPTSDNSCMHFKQPPVTMHLNSMLLCVWKWSKLAFFILKNFDRSSVKQHRSEADERIMSVIIDWPTKISLRPDMYSCWFSCVFQGPSTLLIYWCV